MLGNFGSRRRSLQKPVFFGRRCKNTVILGSAPQAGGQWEASPPLIIVLRAGHLFRRGKLPRRWSGQSRGCVTDRVSIIAPRLGYILVNQSGVGAPVGFLSSPVGVKYNFYRDVERQALTSSRGR